MIKVLDACKANQVVVEINANPWRLDLDYTWIPAALDRGILLSINPDAHNLKGIHHVRWGVMAAQKGGLTKAACLNTKSLEAFDEWVQKRV
jgi:DNA polymerase (family 10)